MSRSIALAATVAALVVLAVVPAAQARSGYCSESGDSCTSVRTVKGKGPLLVISTFSFRGKVKLCVSAPDKSRSCNNVRLLSVGKGVYRSSKGWRANFPSRGKGVYKVTWTLPGSKVPYGPALSFRVR